MKLINKLAGRAMAYWEQVYREESYRRVCLVISQVPSDVLVQALKDEGVA